VFVTRVVLTVVYTRGVRSAFVLVALCGCDLVFKLTPPNDAIIVDSPADTPAAVCPTPGPPEFGGPASLISGDNCIDYTVSTTAGTAVAICGGKLLEGQIDSSSLTQIAVSPIEPQIFLEDPSLSPDGDELWVTARTGVGTSTIRMYRRAGMTWELEPNAATGLPAITTPTDELNTSPPTRGPNRTVMVHTRINDESTFTEYAFDGATWNALPQGSYAVGDFGVTSMKQPSLTEDGLRFVFIANNAVHYAERSDRAGRFPSGSSVIATRLGDKALHPYLTVDCARLYVVGVLIINYVPQG